MEKIARRAWKELADGEHEIGGYRVKKDAKMVVVTSPWDWGGTHSFRDIVAFPRERDMQGFIIAARGVDKDGPATWNPAGAGTATLHRYPRPSTGVTLVKVQAHGSLGSTYPLQKQLRGEYAGWRKRVLAMVFEIGIKEATHVYVPRHALFKKKGKGKHDPKALREDIKAVCREKGLYIEEKPRGWTIKQGGA